MLRFLVVVNSLESPAGQVAERVAARGWSVVEIAVHAPGAVLPQTPDGFDGLVVLGGSQDAWDDAAFPAFDTLRRLMLACDAAGVPVLAICLGAQLLAQAHGGVVARMDAGFERGLTPMRVSPPPPGVPDLLARAGSDPVLVSWHRDSFSLPPGAVLLLSSAMSAQGFFVGRASFGFQCHIEATRPTLDNWIATSPSLDPQTRMRLQDDLGPGFDVAARTGALVIDAWLDLAAAARGRRTAG